MDLVGCRSCGWAVFRLPSCAVRAACNTAVRCRVLVPEESAKGSADRWKGPGHANIAVMPSCIVPCSVGKWKRDLARTLAEQKGRKFEPSDAAKLYGMF